MTSIRGTASVDTGRFMDKQKKILKKMKFPSEFNTKVNMDKVSLPVIKKWTADRILEILGFEDEILVQFVFNMLESAKKEKQSPDPRVMQIQLTGFLERDAKPFTEELWNHIVTASRNPGGIPTKMLEDTKRKLAKGRNRSSKRKREDEDEAAKKKKKEEEEAALKKEKDKDVEVIGENQSQAMKEMLANIKAKKNKVAEEKKARRNIPRSLADCISPVLIAKAKKQARQEKKKTKAMDMKMAADREKAEEEEKPKAPEVHPERSNPDRKSSRGRSRSRSRDRGGRSPPRRRRRSPTPPPRRRRRSPSISESPSPPREFLRERKRRRTRRSRSR